MLPVVYRFPSQRNLNVWITLKRNSNTQIHSHENESLVILLGTKVGLAQQTNQAIVILRLQVHTANHIDPHYALLWSALRQLPELAGRNRHRRII